MADRRLLSEALKNREPHKSRPLAGEADPLPTEVAAHDSPPICGRGQGGSDWIS